MLRLTLSLLVLLIVAPPAVAGSWRRPVDGALLRSFAVGRDPYARGQHRGVDLAAARGSPVRSACAGRVSFAGRVPRGGLTVSVRCGAIVATYQQLGSILVRAGARAARGARLGKVGSSTDPLQRRAHLHLGARDLVTGRYLDPLTLFANGPPGLPLLPPVTRTAPRVVPLGPAPAPRAAPARPLPVAPGAAPAGAPAATPGFEPGLPWSVWVGLGCVGIGLPVGGLVRLRRRRHATSAVARTA